MTHQFRTPLATPSGRTAITGSWPVQQAPAPPGYRFVVADDAASWSGVDRAAGLLQLDGSGQVEAFDRLTGDGSALVVICGERQLSAVRQASALARGNGSARVAVVPLPLGPLGQTMAVLMAQQLVALSTGRPVAELIAWLPAAAGELLDLALLPGVADLDHPGVKVRHHLLSSLPGRRQFVVQVAPEPMVGRITGGGALRPSSAVLRPPAFAGRYGAVATLAGPGPVPEPVLQLCGGTAPRPSPTAPPLADYWGTPEATELVITPADVAGWALDRLPGLESWPCRWCGEPLAAPISACVFCGNSIR